MKSNSLSDNTVIRKLSGKIGNCKKPFKLSAEEGLNLFRKGDGLCAYTRQEFNSLNDITFERINPLLPYEKGNVILVKKCVNDLKGVTIDMFLHNEGLSMDNKIGILETLVKKLRSDRRNIIKKAESIKKKREDERALVEISSNLRVKSLVEMVGKMKKGK